MQAAFSSLTVRSSSNPACDILECASSYDTLLADSSFGGGRIHMAPLPPVQLLLDAPKQEALCVQLRNFLIEVHKQNYSTTELGKIRHALKLMRWMHIGQAERPDGPYLLHPLDVATRLLRRVKQPSAESLIATLLHDVPEDQAGKLLSLFRLRMPESRETSALDEHCLPTQSQKALEVLGLLYGRRVKKLVAAVTNPDFNAIIEEMQKSSESASVLASLGLRLAKKGASFSNLNLDELLVGLCKSEASDNRAKTRIKNLLYLGHIMALRERDPEAFQIKLCDFSANGLGNIQSDGSYRLALENCWSSTKGPKLAAKYGPVAHYLKSEFESLAQTKKILLSKTADSEMLEELKRSLVRYSELAGK